MFHQHKFDPIKVKKYCSAKSPLEGMKRQATDLTCKQFFLPDILDAVRVYSATNTSYLALLLSYNFIYVAVTFCGILTFHKHDLKSLMEATTVT